MKYKVIIHKKAPLNVSVIGENGGAVAFYYQEGHGISDYYHARIDDLVDPKNVWGDLAENGNIQYKDWADDPTLEEVILDALDWIAPMAEADQWERDDSIWSNIFN